MKAISTIFLALAALIAINSKAQITVQKIDENWTFIENDQPFEVKGATFGFDKDIENYPKYFKELNFLGVNAIRTWGTNEDTPKLLDAAHAHGIKVMVGIWLRHGRPGMEADDSFNYLEDKEGMEAMYQDAMSTVEKYMDHPAVLSWGIGNEVYLNMATDEEKEAYSIFLEEICREIKKKDPNHPITSVEAWTFGLDWWEKFAPSIDIYGLNCYGPGANVLMDELTKRNIDKPYIITEFGVTGEWDVQEDKNGIKIEPGDDQKYKAIAEGYKNWIVNKPANLGVFVFHFDDAENHLSNWLFMRHGGMTRPQYWATREAYTGEKPVNNVPSIETFTLPEKEVKIGEWIPVTLEASDAENETLSVGFYYNQRTGSRKRRDQLNRLEHRGNINDGFEIKVPVEAGAIKVYANVSDSYNNLGTASTSIIINDVKGQASKHLVARTTLPFYVYKDGEGEAYSPSAYMGNYKAIKVETQHKEDVQSGKASLKISYNATYDWYGLGLVDPPNDWGDMRGGYDIRGAKKFSFWAKSDDDNVKAKIGFGMIDNSKPYPDTAKKSIEVVLSTEWKQYSINLKKLDLSCIRSGLVVFSSSRGFSQNIYLDNVVFE